MGYFDNLMNRSDIGDLGQVIGGLGSLYGAYSQNEAAKAARKLSERQFQLALDEKATGDARTNMFQDTVNRAYSNAFGSGRSNATAERSLPQLGSLRNMENQSKTNDILTTSADDEEMKRKNRLAENKNTGSNFSYFGSLYS